MYKCKIDRVEFKSKASLLGHIKYKHNMAIDDYEREYGDIE